MIYKTFDDLLNHNDIVNQITKNGGSPLDCMIVMANFHEALVTRVMELESICPRKIKLKDGTVMVYHCPDHLIPTI